MPSVTPPDAATLAPDDVAGVVDETSAGLAGTTLSIAEARTRTTADTLRYYEKLGLVRPGRDAGGRRRYGEADVRRIVFLTCMRQSEMPIRELQRYVALVEQGDDTTAERLAIMEAHRAAVVGRQAELAAALQIVDFKIAVYGGACGA